jgi:hypothetical protein
LKQLNLLLQEKLNIEPRMQRLIFQGKVLRDENKKLAELGIVEDMTVHLIERNPDLAPSDNMPPSPQQPPRGFATPTFGLVSISLEGSGGDISGAVS